MLAIKSATDRIFVSPQNSYVEIVTPNVIVLGGGDFWKELGHEGGALRNAMSVLIRRDSREIIFLSAM